MKFFYLDITRDPSEASEIHERDCPNIPPMANRTYLGPFNNAMEALRTALQRKKNVVTCSKCCRTKLKSIASFSMAGMEEH